MTPDDTLPCGHPVACLTDACALCAAVQEVRDALTERDAALRLADQAADDRDRWRAAEARQEGPWLAVEAARLDAAEARLDVAEAALVDAIHARELAESAIPAGVAVLDRAALVAHVARLEWALETAREEIARAAESWGFSVGVMDDIAAALAATPAESLARVRAETLREAAVLVRDLEPTWDLSEADAYERAAKALRAGADAAEGGGP